jgi:hypothetical protein
MLKKGFIVITLVWITLAVFGTFFWACQRNNGPPETQSGAGSVAIVDIAPVPAPVDPKQWGIEVQSLSLSAADYMLDFRYTVTDPEKAEGIFKRSIKPYLVDIETGAKFIVPSPPKVGPLRQTTRRPEIGKIYYMMFANPGKFLTKGKAVDIVIGDYVASNLVIN